MIRCPQEVVMKGRTWMKVSVESKPPLWVAIEGDAIVLMVQQGVDDYVPEHLRADDTLSIWASMGCAIEGPFDAPE